jgi:excisionase family DNA binding protein
MDNPFEIIARRLENIESLLLDIKHKRQPETSSLPDRCGIEDAISITGMSKSKIYKLTSTNQIPAKRFGKKLVFSRKELAEWVNEQTVDEPDYADRIIAQAKNARDKRNRISGNKKGKS